MTARTLRKAVQEVADVPNVDLHTDAHPGYTKIGQEARSHEAADHRYGEYVTPNGVGTNPVESYFAQFKRSLDGTHHHVNRVHLQRYVDQFDFMYNTHNLNDTARMRRFYGQLEGRRLAYKPGRSRWR